MMPKNSRISRSSLLIVVVILLMSFSAMSSSEGPTKERISEKVISQLHYTNISFAKALHQLAQEHKLSICVEIPFAVAPPPGFKPPPGFAGKLQEETEENLPTVSLHSEGKKVGTILDTLMTAVKGKYYWIEDEGVINVIPVGVKGDKSYLPNKEITDIRISGKTPAGSLTFLIDQLFPGKWYYDVYGSQRNMWDPAVDGTVDIDIKKGTVRQVFNAIVREKGYTWKWNTRHKGLILIGDRFILTIGIADPKNKHEEGAN